MNKRIIISLIAFILVFSALAIKAQGDFVYKPDEEHGFLIIANPISDIGEFRGEVTKYIWRHHAKDKLKKSHISIGENENRAIMYIRPFRDKSHAMSFYKALKTHRPDFLQMGMTDAFFPVSQTNFEEIVRKKSLDGYKTFFEKNYLSP